MNILGINAWHADAAACLVMDGKLIAAAEEERFNRKKHCAGFPREAIRWCLREGGLKLRDLDHVGVSRRPWANLGRRLAARIGWMIRSPRSALNRLQSAARIRSFHDHLTALFPGETDAFYGSLHHVEHHLAHAAGSFLVSPFEEAAILSVDGFGDFASVLMARGAGQRIEPLRRVHFPHSLGLFYTAITQHLGFPHYGDEGKVMALAAFGKPILLDCMREILVSSPRDLFRLNLDCFCHHTQGVEMTWGDESPTLGRVFSGKLEEVLGPAREPQSELTQHHYDIAASLQARLEEAVLELCRELHKQAPSENLALAGGVALNSVANGLIPAKTPFRHLYIQPAAGDSGTAVGVAFYIQHQILDKPRSFRMIDAYTGPSFSETECGAALRSAGLSFRREEDIEKITARLLADGRIVGWFQGRMEFGPRALGNRSILAHPGLPDMKAKINARIKHREPFRPFAPSILLEFVEEWFGPRHPSPHMLMVYPFLAEQAARAPAVAHVDGTGRLQTVVKEENPRFHRLIDEFRKLTGIPMLLNTSFNDTEPIVCAPQDAIACFQKSHMDVLVLGDLISESSGIA